MTILSSGIIDNVVEALSSTSLWSAIAKSVIIILLGFFLTKKAIFSDATPKVLTKIVLVLACPALAFTGFMSNNTTEQFTGALFAFIWGFLIYTAFIFLAKLIFCKVDKEKKTVVEVLFVLGSTTFFGQPLISAIFPDATFRANKY